MPRISITTADLTALRRLVAAQDGPGIVVWCLEHGGFSDAADPAQLRWVSPDGTADIAIGAEHGFDRQVLDLGKAILATWGRRRARRPRTITIQPRGFGAMPPLPRRRNRGDRQRPVASTAC